MLGGVFSVLLIYTPMTTYTLRIALNNAHYKVYNLIIFSLIVY